LKAARGEIRLFLLDFFSFAETEKVAEAVLSPYGCPAVRTKNKKISAQTIARIIRLPMKRFAVISTGASAESA